jgi:glutathione synthase/RimK-type ligase-like ATP-grasp enzyme
MIRLVVARGSRITGELLRKMLVEKGIEVGNGLPIDAVVSYGVRLDGRVPTLNAMAGGQTKYAELETLRASGVRVPWTCLVRDWYRAEEHLPVLGRRFNHRGGTDIRLIKTLRGLRAWREKRDFYSQFIPSDREYRVQLYRSAHLGTYEKILVRPQEKKRVVGRNNGNGYAFQLCVGEAIPRGAVELAKQALVALQLDFGAVDIIHGTDGAYYVLEVNTAPGADAGRQWLTSLVNHIARWVEKGYPARKDQVDAQ